MSTVTELIDRTLKLIGVYSAGGGAPSNEDRSDTLDALNDMLAEWMDQVIEVDPGTLALGDTFPIDTGDQRAVRYNLAVDIWPEFYRTQSVPPVLVSRAVELKKSIFAKYTTIPEATYDRGLMSRYNNSYNITTDR